MENLFRHKATVQSYVTATGVREHHPGLRRHFRALVEAPPRKAQRHRVPTFTGNVISIRCAVHAFSDPSSWTRWRSSGQVRPVRQSSWTSLKMLNSIVSSIAERASSTRHPGSRPYACPDLVSLFGACTSMASVTDVVNDVNCTRGPGTSIGHRGIQTSRTLPEA